MVRPFRNNGIVHAALWLLVAAAPGAARGQETLGQDPYDCVAKSRRQEAAGHNVDARSDLAACMGHARDPGGAARVLVRAGWTGIDAPTVRRIEVATRAGRLAEASQMLSEAILARQGGKDAGEGRGVPADETSRRE